nr:MAG TPA: hypothetical protein [Caudoviricetes sp.]
MNKNRYDSYNCLKDNTDCNYIVSSLLAKMIRLTRKFSHIACKGKHFAQKVVICKGSMGE